MEPGPDALLYAQDKLAQRKKLREMGLPVPPFMAMESVDDARQFWHVMDGEVCIKACRGGYDGHGVWFPESEDECADLVATLIDDGTPAMAERKVHLVRELSAMIARTPSGETALWPVVESVQKDGICWLVIAPAPGLEPSSRRSPADCHTHCDGTRRDRRDGCRAFRDDGCGWRSGRRG